MKTAKLGVWKWSAWESAWVVLLIWAAMAMAAPAQTFKSLASFNGTDGSDPLYYSLVQGTDGNLYGTTSHGGASDFGTIFKVTLAGTVTTLHSFTSTEGIYPYGGLVQATNGSFYGTTIYGGANNSNGTVFKITPSGTLTTLYSFCAQTNCTDGAQPMAALIQGTDGNLYGTTANGGVSNFGTIFKITPTGTLTTLYSFCSLTNCADGAAPYSALIQATDGNFYGTTLNGGNLVSNAGTVFKITPSRKLTTLYMFCTGSTCTDGESPWAALIQGSDGNFYGTTYTGGGPSSAGTIFEITPGGTLTTLVAFDGTDGSNPTGALVQATDGTFYGTTEYGGNNGTNAGTIFNLTVGEVNTLHLFCAQGSCLDGGNPLGGLLQDTNGTFYGTAEDGGSFGDGTLFSLSVGLGPFVETVPSSGKVGAPVKILGTNLTGATSVTFNGTAATFKVVSAAEITTTVPAGATTGKVQVVTPKKTLTSNISFRVLP
jgi:uncharacterized repeat protein (TIGR03803 family)